MRVRRVSRSLIITSIFLLELAVILVSGDILKIILLPLLVLVFPNIPFRFEVSSVNLEGGKRVGEPLRVKIELKILGFGIIKVMHVLPDSFELIESSNAVGKFITGRGKISLTYTCVPMKRGEYDVGRLIFEAENVFATRRIIKKFDFDRKIEVKSRIYRIKRVEARRGIAVRPMPEIDISRVGTPGTDFREIRKYSFGDPVKFINWKASAKIGELMVNEFEREGKKAIWIFLDANPYMLHGDIRKNCFETAIETAASLTYFFAVRGHKVGIYIVGHGIVIYPESGRRQFSKIFSTLMKLDVSDREESFGIALDRAKKYIEAVKPASIFVTRAEYSNPVREALRAMGRRNLPVSVITIRAAEKGGGLAYTLVNAMEEKVVRKLRGAGVNVIEVEAGKPVEKMMMGLGR
ncbi:DUF58 domain-containing protein [Archaeoglobus neptunius]|uniref:DUF58 domain-containing protein n=1 Tax=Archaeoglobus neptunius TaxID=2798580 RepID=UPI001925EA1C|nr:DUF58 domain-containing protein [Archaeoglobus neptunius]